MWFCPSIGYLFPLISCSDPSSWSVLPHRLNGLLTFEVDEGEVTQAVVLHDQAGDYVNRGLSFPSTESTCDVSPVGRVCAAGRTPADATDHQFISWNVSLLTSFTTSSVAPVTSSCRWDKAQMPIGMHARTHTNTQTHRKSCLAYFHRRMKHNINITFVLSLYISQRFIFTKV